MSKITLEAELPIIGQSHDFWRAYSLFVARVRSFAPEWSEGVNDAIRAKMFHDVNFQPILVPRASRLPSLFVLLTSFNGCRKHYQIWSTLAVEEELAGRLSQSEAEKYLK